MWGRGKEAFSSVIPTGPLLSQRLAVFSLSTKFSRLVICFIAQSVYSFPRSQCWRSNSGPCAIPSTPFEFSLILLDLNCCSTLSVCRWVWDELIVRWMKPLPLILFPIFFFPTIFIPLLGRVSLKTSPCFFHFVKFLRTFWVKFLPSLVHYGLFIIHVAVLSSC